MIHRIPVNQINLECEEQGAGTPVVLLHAFPLGRKMWDDQVRALMAFSRAIAPDLRGFGGSEVPTGPYWMALMASDVRSLMYSLQIDRAILVGLSMGGYVAMSFYRNFPDAVMGLVLADTRAASDNPESRARRFAAAERLEAEGAGWLPDEMVPALVSPATLASDHPVVERIKSMALANQARGLAAAQRGMACRPDSTGMLGSIDCPALVIGGEHDSLMLPAAARAMHTAIPGSALATIPGAGHLSNLENPSAFNKALADFVKRVASLETQGE